MHYILITTDKGKLVAINLDQVQHIEPTGITGPAIFTKADGTTITTKNPIQDVWAAIQAIQNPQAAVREPSLLQELTVEVKEEVKPEVKRVPWNKGKTGENVKSKTPEVVAEPAPAPKPPSGTRSAGMFT